MPNTVKLENGRTIETVPLGVLKSNGTEVEAAPTFEGVITSGSKLITGVTSLAKVFPGTEVSSAAFPADTHVVETNSVEGTILVNKAATETKALGAITARNYLQNSSGSAEEKFLPLTADYTTANLLEVEVNVIAVTGTPKLIVQLEDSVDGGKTYFKVEGSAAFTEITAAAKEVQRISTAGKPTSGQLRLNAKLGANGGVVGYAVVETDLS